MNSDRAAEARRKLDLLRRDYVQRTRTVLTTLAERIAHNRSPDLLPELIAQLHRLAGSGGSFGFDDLSHAARRLEARVEAWSRRTEAIDYEALAQAIAELSALLAPDRGTAVSTSTRAAHKPGPVILWQHAEAAEDAWLVSTLRSFGHWVARVHTAKELAQAIAQEKPEAVLVDLDQRGTDAAARTSLLEELEAVRTRTREADWSLLVASVEDHFALRLQAARLGVASFLRRPFDPMLLVERLEGFRRAEQAEPGRVLLIDDDELLAQHHAAVLETAGFETRVCTEPARALEVLPRFQPELVLIDMYMPECSGPELARVIRQHDTWMALPLVFLSAETDQAMQIAATSEGADDFLTKPIADGHLVASVRARIQRARQLARLMDHDGLTGLFNHRRIKEELGAQVARTSDLDLGLCAAMIDLDRFKQINDRHGHPVGDIVLKALAHLLRKRLREGDAVGRYGGEEFLLLLPGCAAADALRLLDRLRSLFGALRFGSPVGEFSATFSAGVAELGRGETGEMLLERADRALYQAKREGRNRVRLAD
ncbi:MAG: hypothetical protein KatS3mg126_1739 [Lysobacteraceae bacterium]|nr:MAG: hypothetical protein KatS3mg126_1739 [Xanthomonadaceae bacterium]